MLLGLLINVLWFSLVGNVEGESVILKYLESTEYQKLILFLHQQLPSPILILQYTKFASIMVSMS